ncbi:DUF948 domain-containing protein [Bacillus testis]|uniref:DUF948 domain-containing protein n=1 Tax=Bacillus testis TaxID=1622072 RepID=UPI00067F2C68|nr:DUF948 domain-containing protein [Bacillus testis]
MEIILYLSAAVAAIAFLILVIYLARTLTSVKVTLDSVSNTLTDLEKQLQGIATESTLLLHKTNALAEDLQKKSEDLNTVVDAVKGVGTSLKSFNTSIQTVSAKVETELVQNQDKIAQIVQWGNAFFQLRDSWKSRKAAKKPTSTEKQALLNEQEAEQSALLAKKRILRSRN